MNPSICWTKLFQQAALFFCIFGFFGCAKFPSSGISTGKTRVIFSMKVEGRINPSYVYVVAIRTSNQRYPTDNLGPLPVIQPPWGNGIVGGAATNYIIYTPMQTIPFDIYKFLNADLTKKKFIGYPIRFDQVSTDSKTLTFEVYLNQLADNSDIEAAALKSLQVNFLTMNKIPTSNSDTKIWDALGDRSHLLTGQGWVNIPLDTSGLFNNQYFGNIVSAGNVSDPDLDIVDFAVEVILGSP